MNILPGRFAKDAEGQRDPFGNTDNVYFSPIDGSLLGGMRPASNRRTSMTENVGTTTYTYNAAGQTVSVTNPYAEVTSFTYDWDGRTTHQNFASGASSVMFYDSRSRPTAVTHKNGNGAVLSAETYVYDVVGNLSSKSVNGFSTTYGYDPINQITAETTTGYNVAYSYDANGNRLSKTTNGLLILTPSIPVTS